ncbi:MAG: 50S ribosomal protein L4 [Rickettsiales bacterium]|jgi:large subunit ribosomal protein L4|nr:50S ribosomal protein L4 [Rickettsiales bacterium]
MMQILVLNLDNLEESFENIDGVDFDSLEGEKCVPYVIKWQLAKSRLGTAKTKLMSEVSGSTRKIVRQKGSGGARHGSRRAVQFVGGRTCFGPQPRDFGFKIPKKIVNRALAFVLKNKIKNERLILIDGMENLKISTKELNRKLENKNIKRALIACGNEYENFTLSLRNLFNYKTIASNALNVYDIMNFDYLLFERKSFDKMIEVLK